MDALRICGWMEASISVGLQPARQANPTGRFLPFILREKMKKADEEQVTDL